MGNGQKKQDGPGVCVLFSTGIRFHNPLS